MTKPQNDAPKDLVAHIQAPNMLAQLRLALPKHLDAARFARIMVTEVRKNPELARCEPTSFLAAMVTSAQLGLEPGAALGQCYFIPFRNNQKGVIECTFILGYRGLIDLARRSGRIKRLSANLVYEGDEFSYELGLEERLGHLPCGETAAAKITHAYAVAEFTDGGRQLEVMTRKQIDAIRDMGRRNPVWDKHYGEMARKTVVRRIAKYLPLSPELADAVRADQEDEIALPPSRTPELITLGQQDAAAEANERLRGMHMAMKVEIERVREEGGDPMATIGGAFDPMNDMEVEAAIAKLARWTRPEEKPAEPQ